MHELPAVLRCGVFEGAGDLVTNDSWAYDPSIVSLAGRV